MAIVDEELSSHEEDDLSIAQGSDPTVPHPSSGFDERPAGPETQPQPQGDASEPLTESDTTYHADVFYSRTTQGIGKCNGGYPRQATDVPTPEGRAVIATSVDGTARNHLDTSNLLCNPIGIYPGYTQIDQQENKVVSTNTSDWSEHENDTDSNHSTIPRDFHDEVVHETLDMPETFAQSPSLSLHSIASNEGEETELTPNNASAATIDDASTHSTPSHSHSYGSQQQVTSSLKLPSLQMPFAEPRCLPSGRSARHFQENCMPVPVVQRVTSGYESFGNSNQSGSLDVPKGTRNNYIICVSEAGSNAMRCRAGTQTESIHPQYNTFAKRVLTYPPSFRLWEDVEVNKDLLALAGFFYSGNGTVECFHCGCSPRVWGNGRDPATTHRILSPSCKALL